MRKMNIITLAAALMVAALCSCGKETQPKGSSYDDIFGKGGKDDPADTNYVREGTSVLELPYVMSDHMVLQQQTEANIFGKATPGTKITVHTSWDKKDYVGKTPEDGIWVVPVKTPKASFEAYSIGVKDSQGGSKLISDVLVGEVWMTSGQSNMEHRMEGFGTVAAGNYQPILNADEELKSADIPSFRYFKDSYQLTNEPMFNTKPGSWSISNPKNAIDFEAIAYFFGRKLSGELNVPIGIIGCAYGGTRIEAWMSKASLKKFDASEYKDEKDLGQGDLYKQNPAVIYNGMVMPVIRYTIKGWLWYQGESNRDNYQAYPRLQEEMVRSWRELKGDTEARIPFYFVQLAGFDSSDPISAAKMRDAQLKAYDLIPNSGIICACDCSGPTVHYPDKRTPAERLALWAESKVYGLSSVNPMAPRYESMTVEGSKVTVTLSNAEGLHLKAGCEKVLQAQVASYNTVYKDATVRIEGNKMIFESPDVAVPVYVRYCYCSLTEGTVYNGAGLPVFPFQGMK